MGGYDVRVYTGQYPNDVVGMVLVDASHEDQDLRAPESIRKWLRDDHKHPGWKKLKYFFQLHLGWARLTADRDAPAFWPKTLREEENFLMLPAKHQFATIDEDQVFPTLSAAQVRSAGNLGDRPLIVLTATTQDDVPAEIPRKDAQAEEDLWVQQLQSELARLSTRGKQIVVDGGHEMPTEHWLSLKFANKTGGRRLPSCGVSRGSEMSRFLTSRVQPYRENALTRWCWYLRSWDPSLRSG
jgi:pimeloyl-ACP methyl ester carboxylesterase